MIFRVWHYLVKHKNGLKSKAFRLGGGSSRWVVDSSFSCLWMPYWNVRMLSLTIKNCFRIAYSGIMHFLHLSADRLVERQSYQRIWKFYILCFSLLFWVIRLIKIAPLCYGTAMFICALTEKLLRTFYIHLIKDRVYIPLTSAILGTLLSPDNQEMVNMVVLVLFRQDIWVKW